MKSESVTDDVQALDDWYQSRCDGLWEHRYGVTVETCDNPGWLMTFSDLPLPQHRLAELLEDVSRRHGAEVRQDGATVRVFARSLGHCLEAARLLMDLSQSHA
jgi:hypothetical protein